MKFYFKKWLKSLHYAISGISYTASQQNFCLMILISIGVIILGLILKISVTEWLILTLTIGTVLSLEVLNTVWEKTLDFFSEEISDRIGHIKDMVAGAVLIACLMAIVIGLIIFLPKLL